jgi:peptide/nickel transport system substrate-binding protein
MVPVLAQSYEVSPDGLTYTIKLRQNIKWHNKPPVNGRPFTSADVAWNIENHKAGSPVRSFWEGVTHTEPDPHTVVLTLRTPDADFLQKLGHYQNLMLAREVKEQDGDFGKNAVGTGPFILQEWKQGQEALAVRNPDYYEMGVDGQPLPYADAVRSIHFADYNAEVAAFRGGTVDYTGTFGMLKLEADDTKRSHPNLRMTTEIQFTHADVWFRLDKAPWNDVRVRKAVALALDREDFIASNRGGAVYSGFVPAAMPDFAWPEDKVKEKFVTDRDAAKKLLAEAGFPDGKGITLEIKCSPQYPDFVSNATVMQESFKKIGVESNILQLEWGQFTKDYSANNYQLANSANTFRPDPDGYVYPYFFSKGNLNAGGYSNPKLDDMMTQARTIADKAKRVQLYHDIQQTLLEESPNYWWYVKLNFEALSNKLQGYQQSFTGRRYLLYKASLAS